MSRLWAWRRPATVRDVLEDLARERKLAYTTVMTVMDNLHRKGLLTRVQGGRAYVYSTVQSRSEHTADLVAAVLAESDDRTAPLLHFVEQLRPDELSRLRASLDEMQAVAGASTSSSGQVDGA